MAIHSDGFTVFPFRNEKTDEDSNWRLRFVRIGGSIEISMHWGDNPMPTHTAVELYDEFISKVTKI